MAAPIIEVADCTESGNNTATTSWDVSYPAYASGDLLCFHVASDADVTHNWSATGPNGETVVDISDSYGGTAQRISAFYFVGSATTGASTFTVTPSASEQWTAVVVKVPAGEFDAATPVQATIGSANVTTPAANLATPTWTAGAKSDGRIVVAAAMDVVTTSGAPSGWTALIQRDRGAVGIMVGVRDAATTASESVASATFTKSSETHSVIGYVINAPALAVVIDTPGALTIAGQEIDALATDLGGDAWATGAWASGAWATGAWDVAASANLSTSIDTAGALTLSGQAVTAAVDVALSNGSLTIAGQSALSAVNVALSNGSLVLDGQTVNTDLTLDLFATIENGSLAVSGQSLALDTDVGLAAGALTVDGQTLTASLGLGVDAAGALTLAGQSAEASLSVAVSEGNLSIAGQSLTTDVDVALGNGSLTIDGQAVVVSLPEVRAWADGAWAFGAWATDSWAGMVGPSGLSVDIDTAVALSIAGQATEFAWSVPWTEGQIGIEGQSLTASLNVAVSNGSLTIDGQTVNTDLGNDLSLGIDAGALTIAGQAHAVSLDVALGAGALTIDGQDVTPDLSVGLNVGIDAGSLTLSGQTITTDLTQDLFVSVDAGSLTLSGQAVSASTGIDLSNGAITITGQSVGFGLGLSLDSAALALSGQDLTFSASGEVSIEIDAGNLTISGQDLDVSGIEPRRDPMLGGGPSRDDRKKFKKWLERKPYQPIDVEIEAGTLSISGQQIDVNLTDYRDPFIVSEAVKRPLLRLPQRKVIPPDIDTQIATEIRYAETLEVQKRKRRRKQDEEILLLM